MSEGDLFALCNVGCLEVTQCQLEEWETICSKDRREGVHGFVHVRNTDCENRMLRALACPSELMSSFLESFHQLPFPWIPDDEPFSS